MPSSFTDATTFATAPMVKMKRIVNSASTISSDVSPMEVVYLRNGIAMAFQIVSTEVTRRIVI